MNKLAIVLARMDSSRLPGKHLLMLGNKTLIEHCLERLSTGKYAVVVATSDRPIDNPLVEWLQSKGIEVFRGSAFDLRDRLIKCAKFYKAGIFARINADSPFVQSDLLDIAFNAVESEQLDFCTNLLPRSFPYGVSVEVFNTEVFRQHLLYNEELENVTSYFYKNSSNFNFKNIKCDFGDFSHLRLTVDTVQDLYSMGAVISDNPDIFSKNLKDIVQIINTRQASC